MHTKRSGSAGFFTDSQLMARVVALARNCKSEPGKVAPKVAALAARDGVILGEAYRGELGAGEHAEYTLLTHKLRGVSLAGATLFTTLEPCTLRNPPKVPCLDHICNSGIRRVFIGTLDPNDTILGNGELGLREAGIEVLRFPPDLMGELEKLNRKFTLLHRPPHGRSQDRAMDRVAPGARGPNGFQVTYNPAGDRVELIPDEEHPGRTWELVLRRNDQAISQQYKELWDKVWWHRTRARLALVSQRGRKQSASEKKYVAWARRTMRELEAKYGRSELDVSPFEHGVLAGRLSALAWVHGSDWESSMDT